MHSFQASPSWIVLRHARASSTLLAASCLLLLWGCGSDGPTGSSQNVAAVSVLPSTYDLGGVGDTVRLTAVATTAGGGPVPGVVVSWTSSDPTVVAVTQEGLVTATGHGSTKVSARVGEIGGQASLRVVIERRRVAIDEAHFNYHTTDGRYAPFAELLRSKGYEVSPSTSPIHRDALDDIDVLVVANALAQESVSNWTLPTPSAFEPEEMEAIRDWVSEGGSMLLIADHMPFPGAAEALAALFGIEFQNNFAFDTLQLSEPSTCLTAHEIHVFRRSDGTLVQHPIIEGENPGRRVDSVGTFTGQAFRMGAGGDSLMVFGPTSVALYPVTAWNFPSVVPRVSVDGWLQGAALRFGQGRVAFFGEAAMFTEQDCGSPMGMNSPVAGQNARFAVNVLHWLSGLLEMP